VSVRLSDSQSVPSVGGFAAERRTRKRYRSTAPGSPAAAALQPGAAARRSAANAGSVMLTAELTRLNTDGLVSILGLLKF